MNKVNLYIFFFFKLLIYHLLNFSLKELAGGCTLPQDMETNEG